ncbi:MAG: hypothetical protein HY758_08210 [Nitrospirae bacterium]|nr:hypothetical protein [Nitrospirota bacterium]
MKLPEYITVEEVRSICKKLKLRDWTKLTVPKVLPKEARIILTEVNTKKMKISLEDFRAGLEVELEHGTRFSDANVTNNHPLLTGKIVMAHLKESMDYYRRLDVAEIEGDILKAVRAGNPAKAQAYYRKLVKAKLELARTESEQLR